MSLQLLYLSRALRPFKFVPKDTKFIVTSRAQNTINLLITARKHPLKYPLTEPKPTNFINNGFYSSKGKLSSTHWTMIGSFFNETSAELLPLKDWRLTALLNPVEEQPTRLIIKKRYRSWSFKKSHISFDRRRKLSFMRTSSTSRSQTSNKLVYNTHLLRLRSNKYFKTWRKHQAFLRWSSSHLYGHVVSRNRRGLHYKSTARKVKRVLMPASARKYLRLSRLSRLKKIGYRSNRLKSRFIHNRRRLRRSTIKQYLRARARKQAIVTSRMVYLQNKIPSDIPRLYTSLLKVRRMRRRFKNQLHKPVGWPYVKFQSIPLRKSRRLRHRNRRHRNLFQKNYSMRRNSLIKVGSVIRMVRLIHRNTYKNRHFRLPPTDFSTYKQKKTGRWKYSYPYMFTNNVLSNKKRGRSMLQHLLSATLTPTRRKRQKRIKLNGYKKFSKLKNPRWIISKSFNHNRTKSIATQIKSVSKAAKVRKHAFKGLIRWVGAVSNNTNQLYINSGSRKHTTIRRIHKPNHKSIPTLRSHNRGFISKHRPVSLTLNRNTLMSKVQNYKMRLSWLYRISKVPHPRLRNSLSTQNFKTRSQTLTFSQLQRYTKIFSKACLTKRIHHKTFRTTDSSPHLYTPTHLSRQHRRLKAPRCVVTSPLLRTRTNISFILKPYVQFFNRLILRNPIKPYTYKFMFKKKLYSFLYPNQVRNTLLSRKKKITFYKLVYKTRIIARSRPFYRPRNLKKDFNLNTHVGELNNVGSIFCSTLNSPTKLSGNFKNQLHDITNENHFSLRGKDNSFKTSEVRIPRIRFNPGYQRLWRQARTALQESLKLRFIYQKKLSRYIVRFFKQTNSYTFSRSEMSLEKTLMYSRLLPDLPTVNVFIQQNLVYLNGLPAVTNKSSVFQNDLLQLIVSKWYYLAYRWIANWTLKRHKKFKRLVYRKGLAGKHRVMKLRKQRSYYTPHWIYLARYDISDIKPYLEVDYMTLSVCVIYNPYLLYYYSPDDTPDLRSTIYRLYNWKYIT